MRPHRWQPTRLPRPWDSPGKNTGVGCHFLLQCIEVNSESEVTESCPTLNDPWAGAYQAPLSMGFSRQEYWSGVPSPSPQGTMRRSTFFQWQGTHFLNFLSLFWQHTASHKGPGVKLVAPAVEECCLSHWTARKVPALCSLFLLFTFPSLADFMIETLCKECDHSSIFLSILQ